jgi:hypothetical protein
MSNYINLANLKDVEMSKIQEDDLLQPPYRNAERTLTQILVAKIMDGTIIVKDRTELGSLLASRFFENEEILKGVFAGCAYITLSTDRRVFVKNARVLSDGLIGVITPLDTNPHSVFLVSAIVSVSNTDD